MRRNRHFEGALFADVASASSLSFSQAASLARMSIDSVFASAPNPRLLGTVDPRLERA